MVEEYKPADRRVPLVSFIIAILAIGAGSVVTKPWLFGGFQLGVFLAWIAMPILATVVVIFEMNRSEGDA